MIIAQESAQSLAALHWPLALPISRQGKQQHVALPLVIPFGMEMVDILAQRPPQRALAKENHPGQALFLDRPDPALRVGIEVRAACRQRQRLNPTGCNDGTERPGEFRVSIMQEIATIPQRTAPSMVAFRATCFIHASTG